MKRTSIYLFLLCVGLALSACRTPAGPTQPVSELLPTVVSEAGLIVEGRVVPRQYVNLSFNMGGTVAELLVKEGQLVEVGQVIAVLDQRPRLAAAVAGAELELINARQALKSLNENAEVNTAAALQKVALARDAVRQAERYLNNLKKGSRQTDIDSAKADVVVLKDKLEQARKDFAEHERKPEDNVIRATYLSKLADAQAKYDQAVRLLNNLQGSPSEIDLAIAEAELLLAQARLSLAEQDYDEVRAGPDPDQLEAAQARLAAAEAALTAAQAALADAELVAPMSGTVIRLEMKTGEQVIPGRVVAVVADISRWVVETQDLNELEIPRVAVGQNVIVIPDALPELELDGVVESISQFYEERFGDVTYTTRIVLQEEEPRLRWGMTVSVRFSP